MWLKKGNKYHGSDVIWGYEVTHWVEGQSDILVVFEQRIGWPTDPRSTQTVREFAIYSVATNYAVTPFVLAFHWYFGHPQYLLLIASSLNRLVDIQDRPLQLHDRYSFTTDSYIDFSLDCFTFILTGHLLMLYPQNSVSFHISYHIFTRLQYIGKQSHMQLLLEGILLAQNGDPIVLPQSEIELVVACEEQFEDGLLIGDHWFEFILYGIGYSVLLVDGGGFGFALEEDLAACFELEDGGSVDFIEWHEEIARWGVYDGT